MSSTKNIKDALIRNNTMIANELKAKFAKKSEVSELAIDKVDKRTFNESNSIEGIIDNEDGAIVISSTGDGPSDRADTTVSIKSNCGDSIDTDATRNEIIIGSSGGYSLEGTTIYVAKNKDGENLDKNILNVNYDTITIKHIDEEGTVAYDLFDELNKVEILDDLTDTWIEYGIDNFNFNKVFSGDDNIIQSQTITFGTAGNYKSLLDLSKFVFSVDGSGSNYDYNDENTNRTRFSNRTQNNPLRIPVKKGGVLTISSGSSTNINATITINNSSTTVTSLPYSTVAANYDQYITILFTSTITANKFTQMIVTNFVNVYVTENKLRANYYNKSEVDDAINNIGGVSLSEENTFTGTNTFNNNVTVNAIDYINSDTSKINNSIEISATPLNFSLDAKDGFDFDSGYALDYTNEIDVSSTNVQVTLNLPENEDRSQYNTKHTLFSLAGENTVFSVDTTNGYGYNQTAEFGNSINGHISMLVYDGSGTSSVSNSKIELGMSNYDNDVNPTSKLTIKPETITLNADGNVLKVSSTDGLQFSSNGGTTWDTVATTIDSLDNYSIAIDDRYIYRFKDVPNYDTTPTGVGAIRLIPNYAIMIDKTDHTVGFLIQGGSNVTIYWSDGTSTNISFIDSHTAVINKS